MKTVIWRGASSGKTRLLRTTDLDQLGIKHKGQDLVWNQENNFSLEMSNQMSDSLVQKLPMEFTLSWRENESPQANSLDESSAGTGEGSPDESLVSGDEDAQASTLDASTES